MARYIDADKAKHEFNIGFGGVSHAVIANQIIDSIPTADVVEEKHGYWIIIDHTEYGVEAKCSECGYEMIFGRCHIGRYCPNCGAKMDGGKSE